MDSNDYCYARPSPNYLHYIGNDLPTDSYGLCEGDCDIDDDCIGSLICQESSGLTEIEGCTGTIYPGQDYCRGEPFLPSRSPVSSEPTNSPSRRAPVTFEPSSSPTLPQLETVGNNGVPEDSFPLGRCQADCDDDSDCEVC